MTDTIAGSALVGSIVAKVSHRTDSIAVIIQVKHIIVIEAFCAPVVMSDVRVGAQLTATPKMPTLSTCFVAINCYEIAGTTISHAESRIRNPVSIIADQSRDINNAVVGVVYVVDVVCIVGRVGKNIADREDTLLSEVALVEDWRYVKIVDVVGHS